MKYIKNRSNFSKPKPSKKPRVVLFVGIILVVVVFVFIFSGGDDEVAQDLVVQDENVAEEVEDEVAREVEIVDAALWTQEVVLVDVEGASGSGIARRGVSGDLFTHVVVATLPAIETEFYFYEGWLVKPGVVEFFSTGEMFAREDGKWGLVWEVNVDSASDDLFDYSKVVITREPRDDDEAPSPDHVIEGQFSE